MPDSNLRVNAVTTRAGWETIVIPARENSQEVGPCSSWRSSLTDHTASGPRLNPEQNVSQIQGKDIVNGMDSTAFDLEAVSDNSAFDWFDLAETQTIEATDDCG